MTGGLTDAEFSAAVLDAVSSVTGARRDASGVWWVPSTSRASKSYRVEVRPDGVATCTCPHGLNASGRARCRHVAAVTPCPHDETDDHGRRWRCASTVHRGDRHYLVRALG